MSTHRIESTFTRAMEQCRLQPREFWLKYIEIGGSHSASEMLTYLDGEAEWSTHEHNTAVHALNEQCFDRGLDWPVPYETDGL